MLVLSRQRDESIMIGDNIVVTIVDIRGDKVRLGINAPSEIPVHRQEVYDAIQRELQAGQQQKVAEVDRVAYIAVDAIYHNLLSFQDLPGLDVRPVVAELEPGGDRDGQPERVEQDTDHAKAKRIDRDRKNIRQPNLDDDADKDRDLDRLDRGQLY